MLDIMSEILQFIYKEEFRFIYFILTYKVIFNNTISLLLLF